MTFRPGLRMPDTPIVKPVSHEVRELLVMRSVRDGRGQVDVPVLTHDLSDHLAELFTFAGAHSSGEECSGKSDY